MRTPNLFDPYEGNILCQKLGAILSREDALSHLIDLPPRPRDIENVPRHIRLHYLMRLTDFHIPPLVEGRLFESIDLMLRHGYAARDPNEPRTFAMINGEALRREKRPTPAIAAAASGVSGTGKTQGIQRSLRYFPQVILHDTFPGIYGPHQQVVWISIDVPPSGKADDLARALMVSWHEATGSNRFSEPLAREKFRNPMQALGEWRQVASAHFLGILHLDEIQNFFKINTLEQRRKRKVGSGPPELSIVEDQCLRWILSLLNTWGIPVVLSGTPDGIGALTKRLSTAERIVTGGVHQYDPFSNWDQRSFNDQFLRQLARYQYTKGKLAMTDDVAKIIFSLTAGVPRIIMALWIAANRLALESPSDVLTVDHLRKASQTYLSPLAPAIAALLSQDPQRMDKYEDLVTRDTTFWPSFWNSMARH